MIDLVKEIEANPKDYIGKTFNAELKFFVLSGSCTLNMTMKFLDIDSECCIIEPADKSSPVAKFLKYHWFGSFKGDSCAEKFFIHDVFEPNKDWPVYCKFLDWI